MAQIMNLLKTDPRFLDIKGCQMLTGHRVNVRYLKSIDVQRDLVMARQMGRIAKTTFDMLAFPGLVF